MLRSETSSLPQEGSLGEISVTSNVSNNSVISEPEGCLVLQFFPFVPWDNEDNLVSEKVANLINAVFAGINQVLFLISFPTNIISMVVFYKHGLSQRINGCLFTLSMLDLLSVTINAAFHGDTIYMFVRGRVVELGPASQFFIQYYFTGLYGLVTSSQLVYSVIALERCLCITRPLLVKRFMSTKTTVVILWTMTFVITGGFVVVAGVRLSVTCLFDLTENATAYIVSPSAFYFRHQFILDVLYSSVYGFFFPWLSFVCVTVCTIVAAVKLKALTKWRESVSSAAKTVTSRDLAITRVIVGTSVLFIVCIMPAIAMRSSYLFVPDLGVGGRYNNLAWVIRSFYQLTSAINNTFNFFIYYNYGSKFRETTRGLFSYVRH